MSEQKDGWHGRFYEDFEVGDIYRHPLGRTVTTTDNLWFTLLTQNTAPVHVHQALPAPGIPQKDVECFARARNPGEEALAINHCPNSWPRIVFQHHWGGPTFVAHPHL